MDIKDLNKYLNGLSADIMSAAAENVAETARGEFINSFRKKSFGGNPWKPAKVPRGNGSLLVDTGQLRKSIRAEIITPERIVISAGDDTSVTYAQVHNEGFQGKVPVPSHSRTVKSRTVQVPDYTRTTKNGSRNVAAHSWNIKGGEQQVKSHTRNVNIPQRQFMGWSGEIEEEVSRNLKECIESIIIQFDK